MRPTKDEYYLNIAKSVSERSTCIRRKFGAVIVKDDVIVSTGYNGPARGVINCSEVGCLKDEVNAPHGSGYDWCVGIHSEENAIINAARHGASTLGGVMYICGTDYKTNSLAESKPCDRCKRAIINAGIRQVVIRKEDGSISKIDVSEWVSEDTKNYLEKLKKVKGEKSKKS